MILPSLSVSVKRYKVLQINRERYKNKAPQKTIIIISYTYLPPHSQNRAHVHPKDSTPSQLQSPFLATNTNWYLVTPLTPDEEPPVIKLTSTLLSYSQHPQLKVTQRWLVKLTVQQKHCSCHSPPSALTTVSVIGFLHFLHFPLYRF